MKELTVFEHNHVDVVDSRQLAELQGGTVMQHFYIRKAGILLAKTAFLAFGLGAIWMMLSLVEPDGYPWWLVTLASVGSMCLGCTFLIGAMVAEDELNEDIARSQQVPVRKIERRSSRRHSA